MVTAHQQAVGRPRCGTLGAPVWLGNAPHSHAVTGAAVRMRAWLSRHSECTHLHVLPGSSAAPQLSQPSSRLGTCCCAPALPSASVRQRAPRKADTAGEALDSARLHARSCAQATACGSVSATFSFALRATARRGAVVRWPLKDITTAVPWHTRAAAQPDLGVTSGEEGGEAASLMQSGDFFRHESPLASGHMVSHVNGGRRAACFDSKCPLNPKMSARMIYHNSRFSASASAKAALFSRA